MMSRAKRQSGLSTERSDWQSLDSEQSARLRRFELPRLISHRDDHEPQLMELIIVLLFLALPIIAALVGLL
jgi:hypothetical protein